MNLGELTEILRIGVDRDDLSGLYKSIINRGLREIYSIRNWRAMSQKVELVIPAGSRLVRMPADFKALSSTKSPVVVLGPNVGGVPSVLPCDILWREKIERLDSFPLQGATRTFSSRVRGLPVFFDFEDGYPTLEVTDNAGEDLTFRVSYYRYLPRLEKETDENQITSEYSEMCVAKVKVIAFSTINDPAAYDLEKYFQQKLDEAAKSDGYREVAGVRLQM